MQDVADLSEAKLLALLEQRAGERGAELLVEQDRDTFEWTAAFVAGNQPLLRARPGLNMRRVLERLAWLDSHVPPP